MRYIPRTSGVVLPLLLASFVLIAVVGCGSKRIDEPVDLQAPFIQITGGPLDDPDGSLDPQSYTARIFWTGWDEDGVITHYEFAIDPPLDFTDEEIGNPETSPGVVIEVVPGPELLQDTLRISKIGDNNKLLTFDWVQTKEFSKTFAFQTPNPDSGVVNSAYGALNTFSGAHRVYVRAQDNDGLFSNLDRIGYTAFTITPEAEIKRPNIEAELLNLGIVLGSRFSRGKQKAGGIHLSSPSFGHPGPTDPGYFRSSKASNDKTRCQRRYNLDLPGCGYTQCGPATGRAGSVFVWGPGG